MSLSIVNNYAARIVHRQVERNDAMATKMVARLSSGSRVIYASDDAASLAVGTRLRADVGAMQMAAVNASHAAAVLQIADGAASIIGDMTTRLKTLAIQSASDQLSGTERGMIDSEYQQLLREIDRVASSASFNGKRVLNYTGTPVRPTALVQDGMNAFGNVNGVVSLDTSGAMAGSLFAASFDATGNRLTLTNLTNGESESRTLSFRTLGEQERETVAFRSLGVTMQIDGNFPKQATIAASNGTLQAGESWLGLNASVAVAEGAANPLRQLLPTDDPALSGEAWLGRMRVADLRMRALPDFADMPVPFQEIRFSTSDTVPLVASLYDHVAHQVEIRDIAFTPANGAYELTDGTTTLSHTLAAPTTVASLVAGLQADADYADADFTVEANGTTGIRIAWKESADVSATTLGFTRAGAATGTTTVVQTGAAPASDAEIGVGDLRSENGTEGRDTSLPGGTGVAKLFTRVQIRSSEGELRSMSEPSGANLSIQPDDTVLVTVHNGATDSTAREYLELAFRVGGVGGLSDLVFTGDEKVPVAALLLNSHRMLGVSGQETDGNPFDFQVGATTLSSDTLSFKLPPLSSRALGLSDSHVRTAGAARAAVGIADAAINRTSTVRGEIGAIQNRFEFTKQNLATMAENTDNGRSLLMDLDVASEMTRLTSQQILVQAGVSVLAQANQMPQQLLRLFQ
jgi:flagellin-like hook-associated protein FlgL